MLGSLVTDASGRSRAVEVEDSKRVIDQREARRSDQGQPAAGLKASGPGVFVRRRAASSTRDKYGFDTSICGERGHGEALLPEPRAPSPEPRSFVSTDVGFGSWFMGRVRTSGLLWRRASSPAAASWPGPPCRWRAAWGIRRGCSWA